MFIVFKHILFLNIYSYCHLIKWGLRIGDISLQKSLLRHPSTFPFLASLALPFLAFLSPLFLKISSKSPVSYVSVALFIVSIMHWMISQNGVCPGILSCWTIQLNMIMLSTLTVLNTQVNEQFTVKCRNIWNHLHFYKEYLFIFYMSTSGF